MSEPPVAAGAVFVLGIRALGMVLGVSGAFFGDTDIILLAAVFMLATA